MIATDESTHSTPVPTPSEKNSALVPQPTNNNNNNAEYVEAIYEYKPQQPEDLELRVGDKVQVLEHTSPDWWRGSIGSRSGMFPSNYVKKLDERRQAPSPIPPQYNSLQPQPTNQSQNQQPPYMYQQQSSYGQVQFPPYQGSPYQQQPVQYQQQIPQQQVATAQQQEVVVQQQGTGHSGQFKKFGSKLGNAAIFGAGATIGSDIVNSIF